MITDMHVIIIVCYYSLLNNQALNVVLLKWNICHDLIEEIYKTLQPRKSEASAISYYNARIIDYLPLCKCDLQY